MNVYKNSFDLQYVKSTNHIQKISNKYKLAMEKPRYSKINPNFGYTGSLLSSARTPCASMMFLHSRPIRDMPIRTHKSLEDLSNPIETDSYESMDLCCDEPMDCSSMDLRPIKSCLKQPSSLKSCKAVRFCLQDQEIP